MAISDVIQVPPGWTVVSSQMFADPSAIPPGRQGQAESIDFQSVTLPFDTVLGQKPNWDQLVQQAAEHVGLNLFASALLHTQVANVSIPSQICVPFGGPCFNPPGGGTTVLQVDMYRFIAVYG